MNFQKLIDDWILAQNKEAQATQELTAARHTHAQAAGALVEAIVALPDGCRAVLHQDRLITLSGFELEITPVHRA